MNKWIAMGRFTGDPEIRTYGDNKTLAGFSLAVNRRFKRDGEPEADFFNCTAFGGVASVIEKYMRKGTKVVVEGEIQNNNYEDKNGVKHYAMKVLVSSIEFAESKNASSGGSNGSHSAPPADIPSPGSEGWMNVDDNVGDDLPF